MERLYFGLADCYKEAKQTREQIKAIKEQYKYAPTGIYCFITWPFYPINSKIQKPQSATCKLLRTKSQQKAIELQQDSDVEEEEPAPRIDYYKSAANKLESIRKEKFFKGEK